MKKIILILGIIVTFSSINAQKWALPSSTWTIGYSHQSPIYYFTIKVEGDTIIDGISCKKIGNNQPIFTYESNDTAYIHIAGKFRPTYYFNASIEDTISFYNINYFDGSCGIDSIVYAVVDSIDSIDVGNKFLRKFNCSIIGDSSTLYLNSEFNYTEYIGSNYIFPHLYCPNVFDQESIGICDYGDSTIQDFYVFQNDCISVSINELENQKNFIFLYPSPANDFINVSIDDNIPSENLKLQIRDLNGKILQESSLEKGVNQLIISHLPSGVYFATYGLSTAKFVKN